MTKEAFVALVTCFNDDETVNYAATRAQVRRQVAAGNNIMCAGTNGDFTALTFDEKVRLCGEVVDEVGGKAQGHRQRRDARDLRDHPARARVREDRRRRHRRHHPVLHPRAPRTG